MSILKRHYEKLALGIFLVLLLIYSATVLLDLQSMQEIPAERASAPKDGEATVKALGAEDFAALKVFNSPDVEWLGSQKSMNRSLFYPGRFVVCANEACNHWLPISAQVCPWCGTSQAGGPAPPDEGEDTDGDGILDVVENKYEFLNPNNPTDAALDSDGDWFTNLEEVGAEVENKTDPSDNTDHPLLANNLRLAGIRKQRLDIVFKNLIKGGADAPKEKWDIVINVVEDGSWKTRFKKLGDAVKGYSIIDVEEKVKDVFDPNLNAKVARDASTLTLQKKDGKKITLAVGEQSTAGIRIRFVFYKSASDPREAVKYSVKGNQPLILKDVTGRKEEYTIKVLSSKRVLLQLVGNEAGNVVVNGDMPRKLRRDRSQFDGGGFEEFEGMEPTRNTEGFQSWRK
ncbi:MAG: hypothetical protein R6V56_00975 [Lentisphaeria bacterium]